MRFFWQGGSERARWEEVVEREWVGGSKMRGSWWEGAGAPWWEGGGGREQVDG